MVTSHVFTGTATEIILTTLAQTGFDNGDTSYIALDPALSIDPYFAAIDPNYLTDYAIQLSPGIGNLPDAVPEPTTWAMMIVGLGGVGAALRRRCAPFAAHALSERRDHKW